MTESDSDTIPLAELLLFGVDGKLDRLADASEDALKTWGRIATALETIASTLSCLTEVVESDDGQRRVCTLRVWNARPNWLAAFGGLNGDD